MHYFRFEISACGGLLSCTVIIVSILLIYFTENFLKISPPAGLQFKSFICTYCKRATFQFPNAFLFEPIYQLIKMKIMTDLVEIAKTEMQFFSENFSGHAKNIF